MGRNELADAIGHVEQCVRCGDPIGLDDLSHALAALDELQDAPGCDRSVARWARYTQHWLSQYIAVLIDAKPEARQAEREATLRGLALQSCEDLRIAIARSWVGAA